MKLALADVIVSRRVRQSLGNLDELAESLKTVGQLQPIGITPERELISGARRLAAAEKLGWKHIDAHVVTGLNGALSRLRAERDENTCRLNLSLSELAALGARLEKLARVEAKARQREHGKTAPGKKKNTGGKLPQVFGGKSREVVAKGLGMSGHTYERLRAVCASGDAALIAEMDRAGKVSGAYRKLVDKRRLAQAWKPSSSADVAERFTLYRGALAAAGAKVAADSVDCIVTDPPYGAKHAALHDQLGEFAARVLKPGGSLVCMIGQTTLAENLASLAKHLKYQWILAYLTPGGQAPRIWPRKVNAFWKPLLWFVKGDYVGNWVGDVCRAKTNDNDKRFHRWGQSESGMIDILSRFALPDGLVCDPFCGAGTTGVAAVRLGCRFVGIDSDAAALKKAEIRIRSCWK